MKKLKIDDDILTEVPLLKEVDIATLLTDTDTLSNCKCSYHKRFTIFKEDLNLLNKISKKNYEFAIMSSNAYDRDLQIKLPAWKRIKRLISKHGFSADIYIEDDEQTVVISFRGTDDLKDWKYGNADTDPKGQYEDADNLFKQVVSQYPDKKIITTGHSLGGGLAIHISLLNNNVDAVVFHPSPRLFVNKNYDKYDNEITIIYEAGEILTVARKLFRTIRRVKHASYRYNFLGGLSIGEHSIEAFAKCMYASIHKTLSQYDTRCKRNSLW